jgi:GMP synthase-like glutamine amidotransferase
VSRRVLFVQQDHVSPTGPVGEGFADLGYDVDELLVVPEERFATPDVTVDLPDPTRYDAIVPMGAPWSVYDDATIGSWIGAEIAFLRTAHDAGVPVLGICFGGQALAAALGGRVLAAGTTTIGWQTVRTERPDLVPSGPWFQWHGDRWELPERLGATPVAATDDCEQAFLLGRSLGVQFHPELTPAMLSGWLDSGGRELAREHGVDPDALLARTEQEAGAAADRARRLVARFVAEVADRAA